MDSDLLEEKAKAVLSVVFCATDQFLKQIAKGTKETNKIEELEKIYNKDKDLIKLIASICFLFEAQKFFWENLIEDNNTAREFESLVFRLYEEMTGTSPKPYFKDMADYIQRQGARGEVMYLGSKICREIGRPDFILSFSLNAVLNSILTHGFFETLKKAWSEGGE